MRRTRSTGGARFRDRTEAGDALAPLVARAVDGDPGVVVLGLPRGGVPVAAVVADHLGVPLDVLVVRKLGHPAQPEFGVGALSEGGVQLVDAALLRQVGLTLEALAPVVARETEELQRRLHVYRDGRPGIEVAGGTAVVVDDGIATGGTARAAIAAVRARGARRVVLAVPVAAPDAVAALTRDGGGAGATGERGSRLPTTKAAHHGGPAPDDGRADLVVAVHQPAALRSVGAAYDDFRQTTDDEVIALLRSHPWSR